MGMRHYCACNPGHETLLALPMLLVHLDRDCLLLCVWQFSVSREALMLQALRDTQGLHAPLRLQMERGIVAKVI